MSTKYTVAEIERRWLARPELLPDLSTLTSTLIEDIYFPNTRLRLRKMTADDGVVYKLGKKYGKISDIEEPITSIYLTTEEYALFAALPGKRLRRRRYHYRFGERDYSINVVLDSDGPVIIETEYLSRESATADSPPPFCGREVSGEVEFEAVAFAW